jgi:hypothetical protein
MRDNPSRPAPGRWAPGCLVAVVHAEEDGARGGQGVPAGHLRLGKGHAKARSSMPITSPVLRISGPSMAGSPGNLAKGSTTSLTKWPSSGARRARPARPGCGPRAPGRPPRPGHARGLADIGHRARGARVGLDHIDHAVLHGVLDVQQPTVFRARASRGYSRAPVLTAPRRP